MKWNQTGCIIGSPFESTVPSLNGVLEVERKMSTSDCSMPGAFVIALCTLTISNDRPVKTPDRYFFLTRIGGPFSAKTGQIFRLMSLLHCYHSRLPNPLPSKKCELHLMLATRDSQLGGN